MKGRKQIKVRSGDTIILESPTSYFIIDVGNNNEFIYHTEVKELDHE